MQITLFYSQVPSFIFASVMRNSGKPYQISRIHSVLERPILNVRAFETQMKHLSVLLLTIWGSVIPFCFFLTAE